MKIKKLLYTITIVVSSLCAMENGGNTPDNDSASADTTESIRTLDVHNTLLALQHINANDRTATNALKQAQGTLEQPGAQVTGVAYNENNHAFTVTYNNQAPQTVALEPNDEALLFAVLNNPAIYTKPTTPTPGRQPNPQQSQNIPANTPTDPQLSDPIKTAPDKDDNEKEEKEEKKNFYPPYPYGYRPEETAQQPSAPSPSAAPRAQAPQQQLAQPQQQPVAYQQAVNSARTGTALPVDQRPGAVDPYNKNTQGFGVSKLNPTPPKQATPEELKKFEPTNSRAVHMTEVDGGDDQEYFSESDDSVSIVPEKLTHQRLTEKPSRLNIAPVSEEPSKTVEENIENTIVKPEKKPESTPWWTSIKNIITWIKTTLFSW